MKSEHTNLFNLGKIISAEKKLKTALDFSVKYKIPNGKLMAISDLRVFYLKTNQLLKFEKLKKEWDNNNIELLTECEKTSKREPNLPRLISELNEIKDLITSRCPHLKFDSILKNHEPKILEYKRYSMARVYIGEGIRQFDKKNNDKADSLYNLAHNEIRKYEYASKPYLELLYEKGLQFVAEILLAREEIKIVSKKPNYVASYINLDKYETTLLNLKEANRIYSDFGLDTTNANILVLKEIAYISSLINPRMSKQHYENILNLINNSEWKNSYLHSSVLFEYYNMLYTNYNSLNNKEEAFKLFRKGGKIRQKLLGSNHPKTKKLFKIRKNLEQEINTMK